MRPKILVFFFIAACGFFLQLHAVETVNLSVSPTDSVSPSVAIDAKGRILVVWDEKHSPAVNLVDILFAAKENGMWTEPRPIPMLYDASRPRLSVSLHNVFYLSCEDGPDDSTQDIFSRYYSFEEKYWSNIQRIYLSDGKSTQADIETSKDDRIHVMWSEQSGLEGNSAIVLKSKQKEEPWPEDLIKVSMNDVSSASSPDLKVQGGNVYACWCEMINTQRVIYYRERIDGIWKNPAALWMNGSDAAPSLVVDNEENVHMIFRSNEGHILYIHRLDEGWSLPIIISSGFSPAGMADLKFFKNNTLHAVWSQNANAGVSIFYARSDVRGNWCSPVEVDEGKNAGSPRLVVGDEGNVHVAWEDEGLSGYRDIHYAELSIPGEKPKTFVTSTHTSGVVPFNIDFHAVIASPGDGHIISFWWDFGDGSDVKQGQDVSHTFTQPGNFLVKLYTTNSLLLSGFSSQEIQILGGPFPPDGIVVEKTEDKGVFYRDKINAVTWKENPKNNEQDITVACYNIYRKSINLEGAILVRIGQVSGNTFKYADRDFIYPAHRDSYTYAVSAVDNMGREGPKQTALSAGSGK